MPAVAAFAPGAIAPFATKVLADTPKPAAVEMSDKAPFYVPDKLTVKAGDTVEWKNDGTTVHAVSTTSDKAQNPKDASLPSGAIAFDSGFIPPGGTFSYTFKALGGYKYFCLPHEKAGMPGYVTVKK